LHASISFDLEERRKQVSALIISVTKMGNKEPTVSGKQVRYICTSNYKQSEETWILVVV